MARKASTRISTHGFSAFRRGTFGNAGHNIYVSAAGVLQRIYQYDLNHNGYFDLVYANCQNHHESPPSYVYNRAGKRTELPGQGSVAGLAADLTGKGYTDLVIAGRNDAAAPFASSDIYFGSEEGYSEKYHSRIPAPFAESVAAGRFDGGVRPALAFAIPVYKIVRIFYQTGVGLEWHRFVDLPIECAQVAAADLDGDGYDELIVRGHESTGTTIYWGGPGGISLERCTQLPELPPSEVIMAEESTKLTSEMEKKVEVPRLLKCVKLKGKNCFTLSSGKKMIFYTADAGRNLSRAAEFDVPMAISAATGDLNGDGFEEVVIVSHCRDNDDPRWQNSFVYWGSEAGFSEERRSVIRTRQANDVAIYPGHEFIVCQGEADRSYTAMSPIFKVEAGNRIVESGAFQSEAARRVFTVTNRGREPEIFFLNQNSRSSVGSDHASVYFGGPDGYSSERGVNVPAWCAVDSLSADFDDDGWAELLICNNSENSMNLDPGHHVHHFGPGGFEPEKSYCLPVNCGWSAVTADFNRNGYLDIVTVCNVYHDLKIFYGGPQGFRESEIISLEGRGSPRWILAVDLNRNGYLDLVVPLIDSDRTLILWGGPGGFTMENRSELGVYQGACARAADLTGNGWPDLIIGSHTETPINGELSAHEPHHSFVHIYWNGPEGLCENRKTVLRADAADSISAADFNNDGRLDLFVGSYHGGKDRDINSFIYWNRADGFHELDRELLFTHSASGCVAVDFNNDGYIDLAVANHKIWGDHTGYSEVWWNGSEGFNPRRTTHLPTEGPHGMTALEPGNILDRGPEEFYESEVFPIESAGTVLSAEVEAELPPDTWVKITVRAAATAEELAAAPWSDPDKFRVRRGELFQYRLALGARNSLRTPRVTGVDITIG